MELNFSSPEPATAEILESITDGFIFYDNETIVRYWNHRAAEWLNISADEALGRPLWDVFPEEVGRLFYQRYQLALATQQRDEFEGYFGRLDRWFIVLAYPSQHGLALFFRDVTERHNRERELQEIRTRFELVLRANDEAIRDNEATRKKLERTQEDYKRLFRSSPLPQCICSLDARRFSQVNEAAIQLYGYSREDLERLSPYDLVAPEDRAAFAEGIRVVQNTGSVKSIARHRIKSGAFIIVELAAVLVEYEDDQCLLVTINDITYERTLEENITALKVGAQKMLTRAQLSAQEEERAGIGRELHDNINQQLASVKLYIEMARSREDLSAQLLEKCSGLLQGAIDDIRSLSKNLVQPHFEAGGLHAALSELCATFEEGAGFAALLHFRAGVADPELALTLYRVVQEALTNVSKYAAASKVEITLEEENDSLLLTVRDDGRGFDPDQKQKGIGLANMRRRVELFNGSLSISSAPGNGCTLLVALPLPATESLALYIMIAEDDADDREVLQHFFRELAPHCRLDFCENGMELLEHLRSAGDIPDLIVIDQNMPLLNGVDTLQALSLEPRFRRVPKVLYSTTIRAEDRRGAYATAYIEKAQDAKGLRSGVEQMLLLVRSRKKG